MTGVQTPQSVFTGLYMPTIMALFSALAAVVSHICQTSARSSFPLAHFLESVIKFVQSNDFSSNVFDFCESRNHYRYYYSIVRKDGFVFFWSHEIIIVTIILSYARIFQFFKQRKNIATIFAIIFWYFTFQVLQVTKRLSILYYCN